MDTEVEGYEYEIRRVASIEWVPGQRAARGMAAVPSKYLARSLLVRRDDEDYVGEEDYADYAIESLHTMIRECPEPYNNAYIIRNEPN
jgi:hypothetical protein